MNHDPDDADCWLQRIVITVDIEGGPGTHNIAVGALLDVIDHFEHDGIQPHWTTLEITGPTTTP
ncbi:MAG TPA: hypothetical protein VHT75_12335 [Acidimicrobiales bacterium]|jgi:hypothetical protein|nr:hypothetical protein [Acidimicrobiales bacterium]